MSDRRELPGVRIGPAQHLAPVGGQPFGVLRMQARVAERMLGLGVGEAALVPRVGESEHRGCTAGGLVDTDLLTGRHRHAKNAIADRRASGAHHSSFPVGISLPQVAGQADAPDGLAAFDRPAAGDTVCAS